MICFILANSSDPGGMQPYMAFHLGLHSLFFGSAYISENLGPLEIQLNFSFRQNIPHGQTNHAYNHAELAPFYCKYSHTETKINRDTNKHNNIVLTLSLLVVTCCLPITIANFMLSFLDTFRLAPSPPE